MDNPAAFPITPEVWATHPDFHGMTLRDWFAGQALAGFTVATNSTIEPEKYAAACYSLADAMLAARSKDPSHD